MQTLDVGVRCVLLCSCEQALLSISHSYLPPWVRGRWRRSARLLLFHHMSTGALKERWRGGGGGRGRMHGRASAVALWTELYCPGNLSTASPRSLFLPLPLLDTLFLPQKHKHINTHTHFLSASAVSHLSLLHLVSFTRSFRSHSCPARCLSHVSLMLLLLPPPFPTSSTRPHPSSCPLHPPPSRSLIISLYQCDCHAGQTVKAKTCNLLICITSFLSSRQRRFSKMFMHKAKPKLGLSVPNQPLLTIQGPFVGTHDGVILPFCFLLLARGCQGFAGGRWLKKQGQMSGLLMGIGLDEHKWSLSLWTAVITQSAITVVSCWDTDSTPARIFGNLLY